MEIRRPVWTEITTPKALHNFIEVYFNNYMSGEYVFDVQKSLETHPERTNHPLYLPFLAKNLTTAAEFQFPDLVNHTSRHNWKGWKRDFLSPVHLVALGVSLSHWTIGAVKEKLAILESLPFDDVSAQEMRRFISAWELPKAGITFPQGEAFVQRFLNVDQGRLGLKLPILIPDLKFHQQVVNTIQFTGDQADRIKRDAFAQTILPGVREVFFPHDDPQDVANLFLNDKDTWGSLKKR
jgi:hypothetical protein